jgi:hypothetical protein
MPPRPLLPQNLTTARSSIPLFVGDEGNLAEKLGNRRQKPIQSQPTDSTIGCRKGVLARLTRGGGSHWPGHVRLSANSSAEINSAATPPSAIPRTASNLRPCPSARRKGSSVRPAPLAADHDGCSATLQLFRLVFRRPVVSLLASVVTYLTAAAPSDSQTTATCAI